MSNMDQLLTKYVNALNEGIDIDKDKLINECDEKQREEFKMLLETVSIFKQNTPPLRIKSESIDALFNKLDKIRVNKFGSSDKKRVTKT